MEAQSKEQRLETYLAYMINDRLESKVPEEQFKGIMKLAQIGLDSLQHLDNLPNSMRGNLINANTKVLASLNLVVVAERPGILGSSSFVAFSSQ